jgi:hypothetical protein
MLINTVKLHNGYVVVDVINNGSASPYHHRVKLDIEDLALVGKMRVSKAGYAYQAKKYGKSVASIIIGVQTHSKLYVDHINGNTLDNRKHNLRKVTPSQNAKNRHSFSRNNTGVVGIAYRKNGNYKYYRVTITQMNGKKKTKQFNLNKLGKNVAFKEAQAYLAIEKQKHGYIV